MATQDTFEGKNTSSLSDESAFQKGSARVTYRRFKNKSAHALFLGATLIGVVILAILLYDIFQRGLPYLNSDFIQNFASRRPSQAGIQAALWGSIWVIAVTAPLTFVIGVASAIYLEEYSQKGFLYRFIQLSIGNLAGVPSIVFGMLGLTIFVRQLALGRSVLAGALTMTLLILPIVIVSAREAIASVPNALRHASLAMGATRWQTIRQVVLPYSLPGILTGTILALSRAIGETAPLIMVGAVTYVAFNPTSLMDEFTVLPIQIYNWMGQPKEEFQYLAAAGIIVLLAILLSMNAIAIYLRNKFQR
ncbi:phosphate ABC transporter permease PstA [Hazenella sp. IB182357]|uniref:Phosphate transport system permease protein PstA n=1 Tax=Polycladospora coralii TaxID=2771432 RepID=A0A926N6U7_9BACL|nr:phosphate ABC transporter permease PstA [Polycladospora coralii]MBD1372791.1 phosphate ABC transporter permease PstA [Polycladospora coralii]MBS7529511.1 phosphate ABC transporter permease PstA [Polycladospora coralii]